MANAYQSMVSVKDARVLEIKKYKRQDIKEAQKNE